jgi:glutamate formiminotransferase
MMMTMKKEEKCPLYEIVETVQATANASEFWLAAELVS